MAEGGIQISIEAHVPYKTYQVRSVSQLWFTPECSAAIAHRNHYFHGYQRSKTTSNLGLFRQARASCKRVPLASKANYASHICHLVSSHRLGTKDFSKSITAFSTIRNPLLHWKSDRQVGMPPRIGKMGSFCTSCQRC